MDTTQGDRTGFLIEYGATRGLFENPQQKQTQEYIAGAFS
jgi:phosphate transport system ATP-binding protein